MFTAGDAAVTVGKARSDNTKSKDKVIMGLGVGLAMLFIIYSSIY